MSPRLNLALSEGGLVLPDAGPVAVYHPRVPYDLSGLPKDQVKVIQPFWPEFEYFQNAEYTCFPDPESAGEKVWAASIVCVPRAKSLARALIARALATTKGPVVVDGAKTDGVDGLFKELRRVADVSQAISKAHGKLFWLAGGSSVPDNWKTSDPGQIDGFVTRPGVFSADGVDPGSALLAACLPSRIGRHVADLGAGWGYLARHALIADPGIETLALVEADHTALDCAKQNVTDPRARFYWGDARNWQSAERLDTIIMNPPFHQGRAADSDLGRDFIRAARRLLAGSGQLWMVANRHLAYEQTLREAFAIVEEAGGDNRFKVIRAAKPIRAKR